MRKIISLSLISTTILLGSNIPSSAILKQIEPNKNIPIKEKKLINIEGIKGFIPALKDNKSERKVYIKGFNITNVKNFDMKILNKLLKPYEKKRLSFSQFQEITSLITKEYRKRGYFVARAYIPKQKMKEQILEISVIEGEYGEFSLKNKSRVKENVVKNILNDVKSNNILNSSDFERGILLINDTPGVIITKAEVKPGSKTGTSNFDIETEKTSLIEGYILVDNHGSRYTGKDKATANLTVNSPLKIGDKLNINGETSSKSDLKNTSLSYSFPLASNGLRAEIGYDKVQYTLGKEYSRLNAYGESRTMDATISYPIKRSRAENLTISASYAKKRLKDFANGTQTAEKDIDVVKLSLIHNKNKELFGLTSYMSSGITLTAGNIKTIDRSAQSGRYDKVDGYVNTTIAINKNHQGKVNVSFQKALGNKNLDGSEDMSIGGINGIKLYPNSEQSAENGYLVNLELLRQLPNISSYTHKVGLFYDIGNVYMEDSSKDVSFKRKTLQDAGFSYYSNYRNFFFQAQLAYKIDSQDITAEPEKDTKFLFQTGLLF